MGRDADFSWFRFVIPASKVVRDDFPTGAHEFIPLNPGDSFPTAQQEIYLVFRLVSDSYDAVPLAAQCFLETSEITGEPRAIAQDHVMMSMSDQSGYFKLTPPKTGWTSGLYHCGLFAGEQTSADTLVDEVRFRIIPPARSVVVIHVDREKSVWLMRIAVEKTPTLHSEPTFSLSHTLFSSDERRGPDA